MRVCFFSDVHGNLLALQAVLTAISREQPDLVVSLGDLIGWGPEPVEVVRQVMSLGVISLLGLHEGLVLGYFEDLPEEVDRQASTAWTRQQFASLSLESAWLRARPMVRSARGVTFCHHLPFDLPDEPTGLSAAQFFAMGVGRFVQVVEKVRQHRNPLIIAGHDHAPRLYAVPRNKRRFWRQEQWTENRSIDLGDGEQYLVRAPSVGGPSPPWPPERTCAYGLCNLFTGRLTLVEVDYDRVEAGERYAAVAELVAVPTVRSWSSKLRSWR